MKTHPALHVYRLIQHAEQMDASAKHYATSDPQRARACAEAATILRKKAHQP